MSKVYILAGLRTPIATKNNRFKHIPAEDLGAVVVNSLWQKYLFNEKPDGIIAGNAVGTGGNIARLMTLKAGLPAAVPAFTIDMQCASGAAAIAAGYKEIALGNGDVFICGGMESSSLQPERIYSKGDARYAQTANGDGRYMTAQFSPDEFAEDAMLKGADRVIKSYKITKNELDFWCIESHRRATACAKAGILDDVIVAVANQRTDDGIRPKMSQRLLDRLPSLLSENSLLNAGNTCLINDGAAFLVLVSDRWLKNHQRIPQGEILGTCMAGSKPSESPLGAMNTADKLLEKHGLLYSDLDAIEFNEAFAAIDVLFQRSHPELIERYNILGGALAYGHPYGASGGILMIHLLKALEKNNGALGLLSIAGAGGMGQAILVRRFDS